MMRPKERERRLPHKLVIAFRRKRRQHSLEGRRAPIGGEQWDEHIRDEELNAIGADERDRSRGNLAAQR